jgi:hypothetical protein
MLPLVCNDAVAILFMFDLSRKSTLNSVKEWYRQARGFNKVHFFLISHGPSKLTRNPICRPRYHFLSAPSLIPLRRSRGMNRRRSRNRPSALPRRCMHLSSFVRHPHRSTFKRSSKSCSQRRSTSNASSPRSKGWVSPYCSTSTFESIKSIDQLIRSTPCIHADCTHAQCLSVSTRWYVFGLDGPFRGLDPPATSFRPPVPIIYIPLCPLLHYLSSFRFTVAAAYHALPHQPVALSHTLQPVPLSIFQAVYFPRLLVCSTFGRSSSTLPTLVKVVICLFDSHLTMA